jgi:hypothetical protein
MNVSILGVRQPTGAKEKVKFLITFIFKNHRDFGVSKS